MTKHDEGTAPRGFIWGAAVVGLIGAVAVVLVLSSLGQGGDPAASAPTLSPSPAPTASPGDASKCGLEGYEDTSSLQGAPVATWVIVGTMAAPESAAAGPAKVDDLGFRSCFAHTAEGAVVAAANIWAMGTDSRLGPLMTDRSTVPGTGRDAALEKQTGQRSATGVSAQVAGFKLLAYDADRATIDLAFRVSTGEMLSMPLALEWVDGDWKVLLNDAGQPALSPSPLRSLGGYTPWAGIS